MSGALSALEIAKGARAWLDDPEHWTQHAYARNGFGVTNNVLSSRPETQTCLAGAVLRAAGELPENHHPSSGVSLVFQALRGVTNAHFGVESIPAFNDAGWRTHADVLAALDDTIAALERNPCA